MLFTYEIPRRDLAEIPFGSEATLALNLIVGKRWGLLGGDRGHEKAGRIDRDWNISKSALSVAVRVGV